MTPRSGRRWVASTTRKATLTKQASALMMGHDINNIGEGIRGVYDHVNIATWLQEQRDILPKGCLGTLERQAQITTIPKTISTNVEAVITDYIEKDIPLREATERIGAILEAHRNSVIRSRLLTL